MDDSKQSINDKAVYDSDEPLLETKTNEVTQILDKIPTCVLIMPSKEIKGEENDEIQVLQPSKQPNKVTQVLTSHQPFQSVSTPEGPRHNASPSPLPARLTESGRCGTNWDPDCRPHGGAAEDLARGEGQGKGICHRSQTRQGEGVLSV